MPRREVQFVTQRRGDRNLPSLSDRGFHMMILSCGLGRSKSRIRSLHGGGSSSLNSKKKPHFSRLPQQEARGRRFECFPGLAVRRTGLRKPGVVPCRCTLQTAGKSYACVLRRRGTGVTQKDENHQLERQRAQKNWAPLLFPRLFRQLL